MIRNRVFKEIVSVLNSIAVLCMWYLLPMKECSSFIVQMTWSSMISLFQEFFQTKHFREVEYTYMSLAIIKTQAKLQNNLNSRILSKLRLSQTITSLIHRPTEFLVWSVNQANPSRIAGTMNIQRRKFFLADLAYYDSAVWKLLLRSHWSIETLRN